MQSASPTPTDRALRHRLPKWDLRASDFGLFVGLLFSTMVVCSGGFGYLAKALVASEGEELPTVVLLAQSLGLQCGGLLAYLAFRLLAPKQVVLDKAPLPKSLLIGLKWLLLSYPILWVTSAAAVALLRYLGVEQVLQEPVQMVLDGGTFAEKTLIYLMVIAVAPICEELVFRGVIFRFFNERLPLVLALGLSGGFFALMHFNAYSFAPLMTLGMTLALAYRESSSLLSPMIMHAGFNTVSLIYILSNPEALAS